MSSSRGLKGAVLWWLWFLTTWSSSIQAYNSHNTVNGIIQNPVVSCQDVKKKILCLPLEYSKFDLPYRNDHNLIDIGIEISDVLKIDDKDYSITFSLYFNVQWSEPRLNLSQEFFNSENITTDEQLVPVNLELIHDLWVPNIYIYNLKSFKVIDVLSKLAGLWINNRKEIYYSQATHITFICPMLFDSFPLDTQVCKFQVGSYSYDMTKMLFRVSKLTFIQKQSIILDYSIEIRNLREKDKIFLAGALGNYSLAGFEMNLQRHVMSYIITYYLPSGLFVVVSWISHLIPPDIVPGRMALLITLFLVLINIFNNITTNSPKAEGLTAIEIWMLACILFVFGSLIEYAVILYRKQKVSKYGAPSQSIYGEKATAAAALASATHSAAAGAISLASGLAKIGANFSSANASSQQPANPQNATIAKSRNVQNRNNPQSPDQQNEEMYDMFERANMYDDASNYYGVTDQYWPDSEQSMSPESRGLPSGSSSAAFQRSGNMGQNNPLQQPQQQSLSTNPNNLHRNGSNLLNPSHVMSNPPPTPPRKNKIQAEHSRTKDIGTETDSGHVSHVTSAARETTFGSEGYHHQHQSNNPNHFKATPVSFVYKSKEHGCRHQRFDDTLRRKRKQSIIGKHYSTWHDKYAYVDRFFLIASPILFLVFNIIYWGYFYFWNLMIEKYYGDDSENTISYNNDGGM